MSNNPYVAPQSHVQQHEDLPVRPVKGIVIGLLIDLGGSILAVALISFAYATYIGSQGASASEIESAMTSTDLFSPLGLMNTVAGMAMSYLAGFYCLRISRGTNLRYPLILAAIVLALGLGVGLAWETTNVFLLLSLAALGFGATLFGGAKALRARP